jgi:hypothetical protein
LPGNAAQRGSRDGTDGGNITKTIEIRALVCAGYLKSPPMRSGGAIDRLRNLGSIEASPSLRGVEETMWRRTSARRQAGDRRDSNRQTERLRSECRQGSIN